MAPMRYGTVIPASTTHAAPLTCAASFEARKATTLAISSGSSVARRAGPTETDGTVAHLLIEGIHHARLHRPRQDGVDANVRAGDIERGHPCQTENGMLGSDIAGKSGAAPDRRRRRGIDDRAHSARNHLWPERISVREICPSY